MQFPSNYKILINSLIAKHLNISVSFFKKLYILYKKLTYVLMYVTMLLRCIMNIINITNARQNLFQLVLISEEE